MNRMDKRELNIDLSGLNVLVTGASRGIGRAIAADLLRQGASVALHYNSHASGVEELLREHQTNAVKIQADLSNRHNVSSLFSEVISRFEKLDVIVVNAGVYLEHPLNLSIGKWLETWDRTMEINLNSVGHLVKLALDHFLRNKSGRFIFIGSRAAFRGETAEFLAYAASKGGITSLSRSIARSFGKEGITSFVIAPGFTRTDMAETFIAKYGEKRVIDELGLNELTTPEDISPLTTLLVSGLMDHATGATIDVNAGSHIR